ncbi:MAG: hypothetical protein NWE89_15240 [Candidatus Bathyarchaeota archaeon]|nr:hypothetical protein [Candidatus Bathyarchaeota archaeon]
MVIKLYVDSNVLLTVWFEKRDRIDFFEASVDLLEGFYICRFLLVFSDVITREISKITGLDMQTVENVLLRRFREAGKLEKVTVTHVAANEATHLASIHGIHRIDALHAARGAGIKVKDPRNLV